MWQILDAYESKAICAEWARQYVDIIAENSIERRGLWPRQIVKAIADTEVNEAYPEATTIIRHQLRCWPDTVDPRGERKVNDTDAPALALRRGERRPAASPGFPEFWNVSSPEYEFVADEPDGGQPQRRSEHHEQPPSRRFSIPQPLR